MVRIKALTALAAAAAAFAFAGPAAADLRIGIVGPMSGPFAAYGAQMAAGAAQAAARINARGGINGEPVELVVRDDLSDPARAEKIAQDLVEENVAAVIGHFTTGASITAAPIYADAGILMITPASTDPSLTEKGLWNTIRLAQRDDRQAELAGRYIAEEFSDGRVALVHDRSAYGKGLVDTARRVMNDSGLEDVFYAGIETGQSTYADLVAQLKEADVDAVYFGGLHAEAALILRQMRESGLDAVFIAGDGLLSPDFAVIAGDAAEGALMTAALDYGSPESRAALAADLEEAGLATGRYALNTFLALRVLEEAADRVGENDMRAVAETLKSGRLFATEIGAIGFDARGDAAFADFGLFSWQRGESGFLDYRDNLIMR